MTLALLITAVGGAWADGIVCTAGDLGKVLCTDGSIYENVSAATTAGKTAAAVIVYVDETNKNGLAIALADESSTMNWSTAKSTCEGKTPTVTGVKWCLPSKDQWDKMATAAGSYANLRTNAGLQSDRYWSSTEYDASSAKYYDFGSGYWGFSSQGYGYLVRACLAFDIAESNAVEVKWDAATKTGTFVMPAFDVDVSYELVRDITQKVDVEVRIDGTATERVRIAKDGDGHYKFVTKQEKGWQFAAVDKLDNNTDLTNGELTYSFKMKEGNDYVAKNFDTDLCPGTWRLVATANADKPYEGIAYSKDIVLYDGYEITVDAGEYATFYKDEALYTEDADAELYTIASVTDTEVVLSEAIKTVPKNTPILVYNKSQEQKKFLLLPTTEQADKVTVADQFKGTLVDKDMPASKEGEDYYVCTGKAFVWVMNEGTIAANKCWLEIIAQAAGARSNTRSITIGGDTTGIDAATRDDIDGDYYDLQGRKVVKPNSKGIYIKNGKKVIKH